jgi:hypothetical protein
MGFQHGKDTVLTLDAKALTAFANSVKWNAAVDSHDVTTFGKDAHDYQGGLKDGTATVEGIYDNTAVTGPAAVIQPLLGTNVDFVYQPEGTGVGKPTRTVEVLVETYEESSPVADMISWSAKLQFSEAPAYTTQV